MGLLNNDTKPDNRWLEELVGVMDNDPNAEVCGSKLIVYGTDVIDSAGMGFPFKKG